MNPRARKVQQNDNKCHAAIPSLEQRSRYQLDQFLFSFTAAVQTRTVARESLLAGLHVRVERLYVCAGGLDIENLMKSSMIYSVSYLDLGRLSALFRGAKPTKARCGDGTGTNYVALSMIIMSHCLSIRMQVSQ